MKFFGQSGAAALIFGAAMTALVKNDAPSAEQVDAANAELATAGFANAQLVASSTLEELMTKAGRTDAAELAATEAAGTLAASTEANEKLTTDLAAANKELATLRKLPGAAHSNPALAAGQTDIDSEEADADLKARNELPHNKALEGHPIFG